jgi:hypothetical protein
LQLGHRPFDNSAARTPGEEEEDDDEGESFKRERERGGSKKLKGESSGGSGER